MTLDVKVSLQHYLFWIIKHCCFKYFLLLSNFLLLFLLVGVGRDWCPENFLLFCFEINKIVLMLYPDKTCLLGSNIYEILNAITKIQIILFFFSAWFGLFIYYLKNWRCLFQCIAAVIFHTITSHGKALSNQLVTKTCQATCMIIVYLYFYIWYGLRLRSFTSYFFC